MRGKIISFTFAYKKNAKKQYLEASAKIRAAKSTLTTRNIVENRKTWSEAKDLFDTWDENLEQTKMSSTQYHKYGNKVGKRMAGLTKRPYVPTHIKALHNPDGSLSMTPKDINKTLELFYTNLNAREPIDLTTVSNWLDTVTLPQINPIHLQTHNSPITEEEVAFAIRSLANGKALGPDGYTPTFYK